MMLPIFFWSL